MEKVVAVWSETVVHEAVVEIPTKYDGSDRSEADVENAIRQLPGRPAFVDHLEVEAVQVLRTGSTAEVG